MKIYNLRGGVSEIGRNHETSFGGGWKDSRERIIKTDTFDFYQPNSNTGFRNVCRWVEWKAEKQ